MNFLSLIPGFSFFRLGVIAVAFIGLTALWWKIKHDYTEAGRQEIILQWNEDIAKRTAEQLLQEQENRQKEADLNATVNKQRNDYAKDLQRRNATALLVADQLREFREALTRESSQAGTNSTTTPRTDDARNAIILECTSAVAEMDADAGRKTAKIAGLQSYVTDVCLK